MNRVSHNSDCDSSMHAVHVSVVSAYIHHRRGPSGITGREIALVESHFLYGFRSKDREYPESMGCVVNRHTIQEQQILVVRSSPNEYSRETVHPSLHSRQSLDRLQDILLAEQHRTVVQDASGDVYRPASRSLDTCFRTTRDNGCIQPGIRPQRYVQYFVFIQFDMQRTGLIAYVAEGEIIFPLIQGYAVEPELVGDGS